MKLKKVLAIVAALAASIVSAANAESARVPAKFQGTWNFCKSLICLRETPSHFKFFVSIPRKSRRFRALDLARMPRIRNL